jgi:hypothetical protein
MWETEVRAAIEAVIAMEPSFLRGNCVLEEQVLLWTRAVVEQIREGGRVCVAVGAPGVCPRKPDGVCSADEIGLWLRPNHRVQWDIAVGNCLPDELAVGPDHKFLAATCLAAQ